MKRSITQLAICVAPLVAQAGEHSALRDLVEANESAQKLIRSVELEIAVDGERFRPTHMGPIPLTDLQWAWKGNLERVITINRKAEPRPDGRTNNRSDVFTDGTTQKTLENWDPESPQVITPRVQGTVFAYCLPQSREYPRGRP